MNSKVEALDGLRGVAAIAVIFSHILLWMYPYLHTGSTVGFEPSAFANELFNSPFTFFYKGTAAVILFFIMSGFVLTYSALRKGAGLELLRKSAMKRYFRLNIPVAASILLCWILSQLGLFVGAEFGLTQPLSTSYTELPNGFAAVRNAVYGSILAGNSDFNYVLWSISIEFFGSMLVFSLIALFGGQRMVLALVSLAMCVFAVTHHVVMVWSMGLFAFGIFLAVMKYRQAQSIVVGNAPKKTIARLVLSSAMLILGVYLLGYQYLSTAYYYPAQIATWINQYSGKAIDWGFFMPILGSMLIISCIVVDERVLSILKRRLFQWLGKLSFSVYLLHTFVISLILPYTSKYLGYGFDSIVISMASVIVVTLLAATYFHRYVDEFAIKNAGYFGDLIVRIFQDKPAIEIPKMPIAPVGAENDQGATTG